MDTLTRTERSQRMALIRGKNTKPELVVTSVGYFGAVRLRDGKFLFSRETGKFNAMTFFAFLKTLRHTSIRAGRSVVVITDNARYHHARIHKEWRDDHKKDFMLDYLPSYSPELNLMRTRLETHAPPVHPQPALSDAGGSRLCPGNTVRMLGHRKPHLAPFIRNYLRRCV